MAIPKASARKKLFNRNLSKKEKRFIVRFTAFFFAFFLLIKILPLGQLNLLVAQLEEKILSTAGLALARAGTTLVVGSAAFEIVPECSGLLMMIMFAGLLYATSTKVSWEKLAAYFAFFFLFNLARLAFTLGIGAEFGQNALDVVHPLLWFVDSGVVFAAWALEFGLWR